MTYDQWKTRDPNDTGFYDMTEDDGPTELDLAYAEIERLRKLAKELSNALVKIRPLGGSEMFIERCGDFYADPEYCGKLINDLRAKTFEDIKDRYRKAAGNPLTPAHQSAPEVSASHRSGERDPSVTPDYPGADTVLSSAEGKSE